MEMPDKNSLACAPDCVRKSQGDPNSVRDSVKLHVRKFPSLDTFSAVEIRIKRSRTLGYYVVHSSHEFCQFCYSFVLPIYIRVITVITDLAGYVIFR